MTPIKPPTDAQRRAFAEMGNQDPSRMPTITFPGRTYQAREDAPTRAAAPPPRGPVPPPSTDPLEPYEGHRAFNVTLYVVAPEHRDRFRSLSKRESFYELWSNRSPGQRGAYRVELTHEEYLKAREDAENPRVNLLSVCPDSRKNLHAAPEVPGQVPMDYTNLVPTEVNTGHDGNGIVVGVVDEGMAEGFTASRFSGRLKAIRGFGVEAYALTSAGLYHGCWMSAIACPPQAQLAYANTDLVSDAVAAINWLVDDVGVHVINMSFGTDTNEPALQQAVNNAVSKKVLLFASMGNDNTSTPQYPAAYAGVQAIANYRPSTDARHPTSNFGTHTWAAAPGSDIHTYDENGNLYDLGDIGGTSAASADATRTCADLLDGVKTRDDVIPYMAETARETGAGATYEGHGVLFTPSPVHDPPPDPSDPDYPDQPPPPDPEDPSQPPPPPPPPTSHDPNRPDDPDLPPGGSRDPDTGEIVPPGGPTTTPETDFRQISCELASAAVLTQSGEVWAWGWTKGVFQGRYDEVILFHAAPVYGMTGCASVVPGDSVHVVVKYDGTMWYFGSTVSLGDPDESPDVDGPLRLGPHEDVVRAMVVRAAVLYWREDGTMWGAGMGLDQHYGVDDPGFSDPMNDVVELTDLFPSGVVDTSSGPSTLGALCTSSGEVWVWGEGSGYVASATADASASGDPADLSEPTLVPGIDDAVKVVTGDYSVYAVTETGTVKCWGRLASQQSGFTVTGTHHGHPYVQLPTEIPGLEDVVLVAERDGTCAARASDGAVWGWGLQADQIFGEAGSAYALAPILVREGDGSAGPIGITDDGGFFASDAEGKIWGYGTNVGEDELGNPLPYVNEEIDPSGYAYQPLKVQKATDEDLLYTDLSPGDVIPLAAGTVPQGKGAYTDEEKNTVLSLVDDTTGGDIDTRLHALADIKALLEADRGASFYDLFADEIIETEDTYDSVETAFMLHDVKVIATIPRVEDWTLVTYDEDPPIPGAPTENVYTSYQFVHTRITTHTVEETEDPDYQLVTLKCTQTILSWTLLSYPAGVVGPYAGWAAEVMHAGIVVGNHPTFSPTEAYQNALIASVSTGSSGEADEAMPEAEDLEDILAAEVISHTGGLNGSTIKRDVEVIRPRGSTIQVQNTTRGYNYRFAAVDNDPFLLVNPDPDETRESPRLLPGLAYDRQPFEAASIGTGGEGDFEDLAIGAPGVTTDEPEPEPLPPFEPDPPIDGPTPTGPVKQRREEEKFDRGDAHVPQVPSRPPLQPNEPFDLRPPDRPDFEPPDRFTNTNTRQPNEPLDPCNHGMPDPFGNPCSPARPGDTELVPPGGSRSPFSSAPDPGQIQIGGPSRGSGDGPGESKYFQKKTCFKNELVNNIIGKLANMLGMDPDTVIVNPSCTERWTGCFEANTSIFTAMKKMAALCGAVANPGDGGVVIEPPTPKDIHHYLHEDENIFYLERVYDNLDLYQFVEVFRPRKVVGGFEVVPAVSKLAEVVSPFEPGDDSIKKITIYDYNMSEAQVQNMADVEAGKISGTGAKCQITTLYDGSYDLYHQVHIQRPTINWFTRWMVRLIENTFTTDGHLTVLQATWLGNDGGAFAFSEGEFDMSDVIPEPVYSQAALEAMGAVVLR